MGRDVLFSRNENFMRKILWVGISAVEKGRGSAWCYGEKPARAGHVFLGGIFHWEMRGV